MEPGGIADQDMSCQCWKQHSEQLTRICITIKEIAHQFDKATTASLYGRGKAQCSCQDSLDLDFTPGSICSSRRIHSSVMDDLRKSLDNLEKEVYRHFMELHSVPLRAQKGRADDRDSAYDSVNFGVPVPETGDVSDTAPDIQASEHDEAMEG